MESATCIITGDQNTQGTKFIICVCVCVCAYICIIMTSFELETVNYNVCCRGVVSMLKQTELSGDVFDEFLLKDTLKRISFKPSSIIVRSLDVWCDIRY